MTADTIDKTAHSPLLAGIIARHGYAEVDEAELAADEAPLALLLVAGDWWRLAEVNDAAVVLPELDKACAGHVAVRIARRSAERAFQKRFHFKTFPAMIFLRGGEYLGAIEGIRDWADYMTEIPEILAREPSAPPPFPLPAGWANAPATPGDAQ